ncbi:hypothetical protein [Asticcacaulis benevestitus]|uniref:Uncharacterized protein n=1 Tax=Asticcacaulis benevestitus DSM 16100 = ATCC BAA-896 TaxID=1121022 RepID=V4PJG6_9CAUL|nr:hypothetical protein [Asticcacaulis benevestitus]ESQ94082.1 hypothetical protein ABENE_03055 [Asticcacaulis benevestitus DSM 16100 = ATCC BAA-896]
MKGLVLSAIALLGLIALPGQAAPLWRMVGDETTCSVSLEPQLDTLIVLDKTTQGDLRLAITVDTLNLPRDWYTPFVIMTEGSSFKGYGVTDATQVALPASQDLVDALSHDNTLFIQLGGATLGPFDIPALSADNRICILGMPNLEN